MKAILFWLLLILAGCQGVPETNSIPYQSPLLDSNFLRAKDLSKEVLLLIEQCDSKEISRNQFDQQAAPKQTDLNNLRLILTAYQIQELDKYRDSIYKKVIDRKVDRIK